jgi:hypothetical protein
MSIMRNLVVVVIAGCWGTFVSVNCGGCRPDVAEPTRDLKPTDTAAPLGAEELAAKECAIKHAKAKDLFEEGTSVDVSGASSRWQVRFKQPNLRPMTRGGGFQIEISMPECKLERLIYDQ